MKSWQSQKYPNGDGRPNQFGHGTIDDTPTGVPVDKEDPVEKPSINMMGQMIENEAPTTDQTRENIQKGNV